MNKVFSAALVGAAMIATPSLGADLGFGSSSSSSALYYGTPAHSWSGLYFGVNGGISGGSLNSNIPGTTASEGMSGYSAGGQVGFDLDLGGLVIGAETDLQWSNIAFSRDFGGGASATSTLDLFGTARARAGVAMQSFMPYVTGGFAYGRGTTTQTAGGVTGTDSEFHTGWTAGGGLEYALTSNMTLRGEYLYTSLGQSTYFDATATPASVGMDFHTIRAGLNFKF